MRKLEERDALAELASEHAKLNQIFAQKTELTRNIELWNRNFFQSKEAGGEETFTVADTMPYAFIKNTSREHVRVLDKQQKHGEIDLRKKKDNYREKKQKVRVLEILKENARRDWQKKYRKDKTSELLDFIVSAKLRGQK